MSYSTNPLTVLSYNISFQAMTNNSHGSAGRLGKKCTCIGNTRLTICAKNMADMIEGIPASLNVSTLDLVGLQEASRWSLLQGAAQWTLGKMGTVSTKFGKSKMVSFYNDNRFTLSKNFNGEFSPDRPFQILVLKENYPNNEGVIFINTHNPHGYSFCQVKQHLSDAVSNFLTDEEKKYRIIAVGDFNETGWHWNDSKLDPKTWQPFSTIDTPVSIQNVIFSCSEDNGDWSNGHGGIKKAQRGGDYIFDSQSPAKIEVPPAYDATKLLSDHLPVVAVL